MSDDIEILCIVDASGSMFNMKDYVVTSFNELLEDRKKDSPDAVFSLLVFNHAHEFVTRSRPVHAVDPLTHQDYAPSGSTALYDAIGKGFENLGDAKKAFICIITDGMENASTEFTGDQVAKLIDKAYEKGYKLLFMGASKDQIMAQTTALRINSNDARVGDFSTEEGIFSMTRSASDIYRSYTGKL